MNSIARIVSGAAFALLAGSLIIYAFTRTEPAASETQAPQRAEQQDPLEEQDLVDQPYNFWNLTGRPLDNRLRGQLQAESAVLAFGNDADVALAGCPLWNFCKY
jgi:hypothetical protein